MKWRELNPVTVIRCEGCGVGPELTGWLMAQRHAEISGHAVRRMVISETVYTRGDESTV